MSRYQGAWWDLAKPFDLIMTWPRYENHDLVTFVISGGISLFTGGGPSHVLCYLGRGRIWEVTYPKPRFARAMLWNTEDYDLEIGYHIKFEHGITSADARTIKKQMAAIVRSGKEYDIGELAWHLLDEVGVYSEDKSDPARFVCSSGVVNAFSSAGAFFTPQQQLMSPQDIRMSNEYKIRAQLWDKET